MSEVQRTVGVFRNTQFRPSEPFIVDQASALRGWTVKLLSRDRLSQRGSVFVTDSLQAGSQWRWLLFRAGWRRALTQLLHRADIDVVHAHFGVDGYAVAQAASILRIPLVVTLHGFDVTMNRASLLRSLKVGWVTYAFGRRRFFANPSIEFVAVSNHIASRARKLGVRDSRLTIIPTGVDTKQLQPTPIPSSATVVHVARLVEKKGTKYLIEAIAILNGRGLPVRLTIVGDGPLREDLTHLVRSLGIESLVSFVGAQRHVDALRFIEQSRVLCLPSITASTGDEEGLGQVILEAMALNRVVVASRSGGIVDAVEDGRSGLLAEPADPRSLASQIERAIGPEGAQLAVEGRRTVETRFDVTNQAARLASLYEEAAGR
ncbi:glycosyltransferase [Curtobacterium citreum]